MVRRHARSPVAPSAYVFPGGTIRADDLEFEPELNREGLAQAISVRADTPVEPTQAAAFYVSALRELRGGCAIGARRRGWRAQRERLGHLIERAPRVDAPGASGAEAVACASVCRLGLAAGLRPPRAVFALGHTATARGAF